MSRSFCFQMDRFCVTVTNEKTGWSYELKLWFFFKTGLPFFYKTTMNDVEIIWVEPEIFTCVEVALCKITIVSSIRMK